MAKHMVQCRGCGERFDAPLGEMDISWVMPSRNFYYHKDCYEKFRKDKPKEDEAWRDRIFDYISHDLKLEYNYFKCARFLDNFVKKEKQGTYKGCYFSLKYFYEVDKGNKEKANGGIGIIPFVYERATEYWKERELRERGALATIEAQIIAREKNQQKTKRFTPQEKKKKDKWNLEEL